MIETPVQAILQTNTVFGVYEDVLRIKAWFLFITKQLPMTGNLWFEIIGREIYTHRQRIFLISNHQPYTVDKARSLELGLPLLKCITLMQNLQRMLKTRLLMRFLCERVIK